MSVHFDPFHDLLHSLAEARRAAQPIIPAALSPFQRCLLSLDGTVTAFLEAYTLEPIEIVRLRQEHRLLAGPHEWLEAEAGVEVVAREVLLRGERSRKVYAYAVSLLIPERLPAGVLQALEGDPLGSIGRALLQGRVESRREVLWQGVGCVPGLAAAAGVPLGERFISRAYTIVVGGRPVMLINEKFPVPAQA